MGDFSYILEKEASGPRPIILEVRRKRKNAIPPSLDEEAIESSSPSTPSSRSTRGADRIGEV
jgi:hypothetical protein